MRYNPDDCAQHNCCRAGEHPKSTPHAVRCVVCGDEAEMVLLPPDAGHPAQWCLNGGMRLPDGRHMEELSEQMRDLSGSNVHRECFEKLRAMRPDLFPS